MKKQNHLIIKYILVLLVALTFAISTNGCKNISKVDKQNIDKNKTPQNNSKKLDDNNDLNEEKILALGKAQRSSLYEYIPSKVKRTSSITGDLGWQYRTEVNPNATKPTDDGETYNAPSGKIYVLVFLTVKNITDMSQEPLISYDPQPTLESQKTKKSYEYDSLHSYRLKESEQFSEVESLEPGKSKSGWVLYEVPASETNLLFKIEGLLWKL